MYRNQGGEIDERDELGDQGWYVYTTDIVYKIDD